MSQKVALSVADLQDIQAGPVAPVPTRFTVYLFFKIDDQKKFREIFREEVLPLITTADQARKIREEVVEHKNRNEMATVAGVNVSFTQSGLAKLTADADPKDSAFKEGQLKRAESILADNTAQWLEVFKQPFDGHFEVAGFPEDHVRHVAEWRIREVFAQASAASVVFEHHGQARKGDQKGHEHFGFNDGISQPFVRFEDDAQQVPKRESNPGQTVINPGILILGQHGDETARPAWAKNGSFVVYRHLKQLVPEFNIFLKEAALKLIFDAPHPIGEVKEDELQKRIDFLGARLMGRWKSGFPVVLSPMIGGKIPEDNPEVGKDPKRNNDYNYGPRQQDPREQFLCPFGAHARKTAPRTDIDVDGAERRMIRRGGMPYGFDVKLPEEETKTIYERGLSFVCYQSSLEQGFELIQQSWSNNVHFPANTGAVAPGFDAIVGQNHGDARVMTGFDPENLAKPLIMPQQFVISQGGEYFFLPSISALKLMTA